MLPGLSENSKLEHGLRPERSKRYPQPTSAKEPLTNAHSQTCKPSEKAAEQRFLTLLDREFLTLS